MGSLEKARELYDVFTDKEMNDSVTDVVVLKLGLDPREKPELCEDIANRLRERSAEVYAEGFSDEEMGRLIDMYNSPLMVRLREFGSRLDVKFGEMLDELQTELSTPEFKELFDKLGSQEESGGSESD